MNAAVTWSNETNVFDGSYSVPFSNGSRVHHFPSLCVSMVRDTVDVPACAFQAACNFALVR